MTGYRLLPNPQNLAFVAVAAFKHPELIRTLLLSSQCMLIRLDFTLRHIEDAHGAPRLAPALMERTKRKIRAMLAMAIDNGHDSVVLAQFLSFL